MRIGIIGYGKMGHEIQQLAIEQNHSVNLIIDLENSDELNPVNLKKVDMVFEFTTPEAAPGNIMKCFNNGVPVVSGTTGWLNNFEQVANHCRKTNQSFFYAANFCLGVNILYNINRSLAKIMNRFPEYEIEIEEIHHTQKLDSPSGTAITLANEMIPILDMKDSWKRKGDNKETEIPVRSIREGAVPGTHSVKYESEVDKLEIRHSAKSRKGFALGALLSAEFLMGKKGVFGMKDLLSI